MPTHLALAIMYGLCCQATCMGFAYMYGLWAMLACVGYTKLKFGLCCQAMLPSNREPGGTCPSIKRSRQDNCALFKLQESTSASSGNTAQRLQEAFCSKILRTSTGHLSLRARGARTSTPTHTWCQRQLRSLQGTLHPHSQQPTLLALRALAGEYVHSEYDAISTCFAHGVCIQLPNGAGQLLISSAWGVLRLHRRGCASCSRHRDRGMHLMDKPSQEEPHGQGIMHCETCRQQWSSTLLALLSHWYNTAQHAHVYHVHQS